MGLARYLEIKEGLREKALFILLVRLRRGFEREIGAYITLPAEHVRL
jgi:hypothetical protein